MTLQNSIFEKLMVKLDAFNPELCGFAYEDAGIGLAAGYTGGVGLSVIKNLLTASDSHQAQLTLGIAETANARHSVGNPSPTSDSVSEVVWGFSSQQLSRMVEAARENLPPDGVLSYEIWRQRVAAQFVHTAAKMPAQKEIPS